ncbi:hypothetical protein HDR64_04065, partial [bacterium]|nr:hypothetical protein [bacterium]
MEFGTQILERVKYVYGKVEEIVKKVKQFSVEVKEILGKIKQRWEDVKHFWEEVKQACGFGRNIDTENKENLFLPRLSIKLNNFQFYHTASTSEKVDARYIHRPKLEHKLKNWLTEQSGRGVYLITGHRGTGKSSLVGAVIRDIKKNYHEDDPKYIDICVNIGQDNIKELHILHVVVKKLRGELAKARTVCCVSIYSIFKTIDAYRWWMVSFILGIFCFRYKTMDWVGSNKVDIFWQYALGLCREIGEGVAKKTVIDVCLNAFVWLSLLLLIANWFVWRASKYMKSLSRLDVLCDRLYSSTKEVVSGGIKIVDWFNQHRKERMNPVISIREIEYDLTEILESIEDRWRIVVVFDELDKVEPQEAYKMQGGGQVIAAHEARRQQVLDMIANMKYFLSTARAYFVFIAGPELYDAAMADISDRNFAIGNLFNGVLRIDSFYTRKGLSEAIALTEEFVCRQIMRPPKCSGNISEDFYRLKNYPKTYRGGARSQEEEIVFLYHFICYLAFISHGSPKKIAVFFEKYVRNYEYLRRQKQTYGISKKSKDRDWYLTFSDHQQMKINFVHYLTFPILQNIMDRSAIFGDKLRVAESFIFAHIVKLHNSGFSWRNIEQIPEIMAINREPEVREYIQAILMNMQQGSIKQIICGLYTYKFPLRLAEEISYFSKMSDELAALLNFSIGELQPIKEHYFALLDKLPTNVEREKEREIKLHMCEHVYAEASIRHALGDIYMQEENFSAAIRQFARCVELTTPLLIEPIVNTHRQLQNYVLFYYRTMLKLGLAHEKRHTDNSAYVVYGDLLRVLFEVKDRYPAFVAPLFRDNRGLHLGILAQLYVLERIGTTGITCLHIAEAIERFDKLYQLVLGGLKTSVCNPIVKADFYRKLGDIMFYKNFKCIEKGYSAIWAYEEGIEILLMEKGLEGRDFWQKVYGYLASQRDDTGGGLLGDKTWIYSLAILFESLGHAYIGISRLKDLESEGGQIAWIFNTIIREERGGDGTVSQCNGFDIGNAGTFAQGLYCYWVAAKLEDVMGGGHGMCRSYRNLLSVLELYIKQCYRHKNITLSDEKVLKAMLRMANFITMRLFMGTYKSYEHVNMIEKDLISHYFSFYREKSQARDVRVQSFLSVKTDIEEFVYAYFRLLIEYGYIDTGVWFVRRIRKDLLRGLLQIVKTDSISNATLTTLVNRHRLIVCMYDYYLSDLLNKGNNSWHTPADISSTEVKDFIEGYSQNVSDFMQGIGEREFFKFMCDNCRQVDMTAELLKMKNRVLLDKKVDEIGEDKKFRFFVLNKILVDAVRRS